MPVNIQVGSAMEVLDDDGSFYSVKVLRTLEDGSFKVRFLDSNLSKKRSLEMKTNANKLRPPYPEDWKGAVIGKNDCVEYYAAKKWRIGVVESVKDGEGFMVYGENIGRKNKLHFHSIVRIHLQYNHARGLWFRP